MSEDRWDLKKIDAQIDALKGSLSALKSACQSAQGSYCTGGGVSCNTASMLKSVCAAQITVIENEIKLLTYMKKRIYFAKPNREYFE